MNAPRKPTTAERIFNFDPGVIWQARDTIKRVRVKPLDWTMPGSWTCEDRVCLGLTSHGSVDFLSAASLVRLVAADRNVTGPLVAQGPLVHVTRRQVVEQFLERPELGGWLCSWTVTCWCPRTLRARSSKRRGTQAPISWARATRQSVAARPACSIRAGGKPVSRWCLIPSLRRGARPSTCHAVGFGAVLLSREVLAAAAAEYRGHGRDALFCPSPDRPSLGEDFAFCLRAKGLESRDVRVVCCNVSRIRHQKTVPLCGANQAALPAMS
jgi:hypothetical protein